MKKSFVFLSKFIVVALWSIFAAGCANPLLQEDYENKELTQQKFCEINNLYHCFDIEANQKRIDENNDDLHKSVNYSKCEMIKREEKYVAYDCSFERKGFEVSEREKKNIFEMQITDRKGKDKYGDEFQIVEIKRTDETGQTEVTEVMLLKGITSLLSKPDHRLNQIFPFLYPVVQHRFADKRFDYSYYTPRESAYYFWFQLQPYVKVFKNNAAGENEKNFVYEDCHVIKNEKGAFAIECLTKKNWSQVKKHSRGEESHNLFEVTLTGDDEEREKSFLLLEVKQTDETSHVSTYSVTVPKEESFLPNHWFYRMFPFLYRVPQDRIVDERLSRRLEPLSRMAGYYYLTPTKITGEYVQDEKTVVYNLYSDCRLLANKEGCLMYKCQKKNVDSYCKSMKECEEKQENNVEYVAFKVMRYEKAFQAWEINLEYYDKLYHSKIGETVISPSPEKEEKK